MAKLGTFVAAQVLTAAELNAGAGAWTTWSPTYTNLTVATSPVVAKYAFFGRTVLFKWQITLVAGSAVGTSPMFSVPVAAADGVEFQSFKVLLFDTSATLRVSGSASPSSGAVALWSDVASTTPVTQTALSATSPFTWAVGDVIAVSGTYEATS